jgi:glutamate synthase (NADPH/NADH) small chain
MSQGKKSFFSPFSFWGNVFKPSTTVRFPKEDIDVFDKPGASPTYRGLHTNDISLCIGCGTCEDICPTNAITMVEGENVGEGKLGKRPEIDYGRCCFCAFCVDMCPSGSLCMSREYIRHYRTRPELVGDLEVEDIRRSFRFVPDDSFSDNKGHVTSDEESWLDLVRVPMEERSPGERWDSFVEIVRGFSRDQALKEASRCIECGVCKESCPAGMNIPEYIRAIWDDDLEESVRQMYLDNPLPNVCGRVCTHKCEEVCAISHRGQPISIRWLKRYAVDNLAPESLGEAAGVSKLFGGHPRDRKVSIVGSGPAGLSAAYYLAIMGYRVTVFEEKQKPGGIMRYGIPKYRLPDDALDRDIEAIRRLGVVVKTGIRIGRDIGFEELHGNGNADAVFIATGFSSPRSTGVKGIDGPGCYQALDLLADQAAGKQLPVGKKIVIIGGGNVAFDIGRTLARLQRKQYGEVDLTLTCLEKEDEMLADEEEIVQGREEGLSIRNARSPKRVLFERNGAARGLATVGCLSIFDEKGRFNPKVDPGDKESFPGDMIVEAIGQAPDYDFLGGELLSKLDIVRGRIVTDEDGGTDIPWLFAGGDIVHGPDVVHAVADGHRSARSIDAYLSGM